MGLKGYSYRCDSCGIGLARHYCNECGDCLCDNCWNDTAPYHCLGRCAKGFQSEYSEMKFNLNDFVPV